MAGSSPPRLEALALCFLVFLLPGVSGCGGNLTAPFGGPVTSPNYPGNYGDNQDCEWLITVPVGSLIRLTFHSFYLEQGYDFLRIYDGASASVAVLQELTGPQSVSPIGSTSNVMFLRFTSDNSVERQGFNFSYTSHNTSGCPTVVLYSGSNTLKDDKMASYTMTGDTRGDRPVYYSSATCTDLYYNKPTMEWHVGQQFELSRALQVKDSALYADQINGTFLVLTGQEWIENPDVKIACSDDVPADVVVAQSAGGATNCARVRLHGHYLPSAMTTYTRTDQTSGGRPVYVSDTNSQDFLHFVEDFKQWWVGPTIGERSGFAYVPNCAVTPDLIRSPWLLWDGNRWQVVWSVTASCVGKLCQQLMAPSNGNISGGSSYGNVVTYYCDAGYEISGDKERTCQSDQTWSGTQPTCAPQ
ncbi:PREDICTED: CUB and sushi domain-containing protein 3-like [Branchiostoma belcheri]|uniref:CUB and sushi domain-containing protein 3-like n=1 Tax=Branchiostoma belcheri TaxID=7741 RepID=A0A6P4Y5X7_BRABE|nr:PREDICTED: CUB and sushi domain-containing protein 3-like [Branchiostoma belcheri]